MSRKQPIPVLDTNQAIPHIHALKSIVRFTDENVKMVTLLSCHS